MSVASSPPCWAMTVFLFWKMTFFLIEKVKYFDFLYSIFFIKISVISYEKV